MSAWAGGDNFGRMTSKRWSVGFYNNSSRLVGQSSPLFQIILTYFTSISVIPPKLTLFFIHFQFLLFVAWVCVLKYFGTNTFKYTNKTHEEPAAEFFRGITIFSWVMTVLVTLTFVMSFDKLCARPSRWTLTASNDPLFLPMAPSLIEKWARSS